MNSIPQERVWEKYEINFNATYKDEDEENEKFLIFSHTFICGFCFCLRKLFDTSDVGSREGEIRHIGNEEWNKKNLFIYLTTEISIIIPNLTYDTSNIYNTRFADEKLFLTYFII